MVGGLYPPSRISSIRLEQDNMSCMTILNKGKAAAETNRFIEIRKFYDKNGSVDMVYVPTADMTSDYFTKPLQGTLFAKIFKKMMVWCVVGGCYTLISVGLTHQCLIGLLVCAPSLLCEGRGFEPPHGRG
jgi:hypothetical protein